LPAGGLAAAASAAMQNASVATATSARGRAHAGTADGVKAGLSSERGGNGERGGAARGQG
jgi:hypothetical protein